MVIPSAFLLAKMTLIVFIYVASAQGIRAMFDFRRSLQSRYFVAKIDLYVPTVSL